jgi:hypothetical protein
MSMTQPRVIYDDPRVPKLVILSVVLAAALTGVLVYFLAFHDSAQPTSSPVVPSATPSESPAAPTVTDPVRAIYKGAPGYPDFSITCDNARFRVLQVQGYPEATRYVKDPDSCPPKR